jgi:hypothetical protein
MQRTTVLYRCDGIDRGCARPSARRSRSDSDHPTNRDFGGTRCANSSGQRTFVALKAVVVDQLLELGIIWVWTLSMACL